MTETTTALVVPDPPEHPTFTNSCLGTWRRCNREYLLRYQYRLERAGDDREVLLVGQCWHKMHEAEARARIAGAGAVFDAGFEASLRAPSALWAEKLRRLYAAYHWYWKDQPLKIVEPEHTFRVEPPEYPGLGVEFEGQIDAIVELPDGRRGLLERKTTSFGLEPTSSFWEKLRLDTQCGIYGMAAGRPAFIIYDVVRKPTINPKALSKADVTRMRKELAEKHEATYFGEQFSHARAREGLDAGRESIEMYGARLTADIGDRPEYYFARREVPRTSSDYDTLTDDLVATVTLLENADHEHAYPRNPDACNVFGLCDFFGICSQNQRPRPGMPVPAGYRVREHRHAELAPQRWL